MHILALTSKSKIVITVIQIYIVKPAPLVDPREFLKGIQNELNVISHDFIKVVIVESMFY